MARITEEVTITGLSEVLDRLRALPQEFQEKFQREVLKKAAQPILEHAIATVPVGETGNLAAGIRIATTRKGGNFKLQVTNDAQHAQLVEFGHKIVTKLGRDTGKRARSVPTMRNALAAGQEKALDIIEQEVGAVMTKMESKWRSSQNSAIESEIDKFLGHAFGVSDI